MTSVPTKPDLDITVVNTTSCAANNGSITVAINDPNSAGTLDPNDFTFTWYNGSQTIAGNLHTVATVGNNSIATLADGDYTVIVRANTQPGEGCSTTATSTVGDDKPVLVVAAATPTASVDCNGNGQIEITDVSVDGVSILQASMVNYTYSIYDNTTALISTFNTPPTGTTNPIHNLLAAGTYFIGVSDPGTSGCESDLVQVVINNNSVNPDISIAITSQNTVCDNAVNPYNGSLTVSVAGGDGNYDYAWHSGSNINVNNPIGQTTATAIGLQEGFYWVQVTDNTTAGNTCSAKAVVELTSNFDDISVAIADITITPASDCTGANATGTIEVTDVRVGGTPQGTAGYTFEFFAEGNINAAVSTNNPYASVTPGDYFVVATDATTGCNSAPVQVTVDQDDNVPSLVFTENAPNSACIAANYNGSLSVAVSDGAGGTRDASEFTFQWYEGSQPIVGSTVDNADGGNTNTIFTVQGGDYSVVVTAIGGSGIGCSAIGTSKVTSAKPTLKISNADITASNSCNPDENGSIEITGLTLNGATLSTESSLDDYTFALFDDSFASLGAFDTPGTSSNFPSTSGLAEGVYYVVATNVNGCKTTPFLVEIDDVSSNPVISFNQELADNSCNGTDATGSLSVTVPGENIADYTVEWYTGDLSAFGITPVNPANISTSNNKSIISGVAAGQYSVSVTDNTIPGNNCLVLGTGVIENNFAEITIPVITATANQKCTAPYDGTITGNQVRENGTLLSPVATAANYTFTYFDEDFNLLADNTTLQGGTYYVVAENNTTGCTSDATQVNVAQDLDNLELAFTNTPNTSCAGAGTYTGSVTATVTYNGNTFTGRYSFTWYEGNTVGIGLISTGISSGATDNISTVSDLESKQYTVVVTDNTTGCTITGIHTVPELLDIPTLTIPDARITESSLCTPGGGNGSITLVNSDISPGNLSDYDFDWYLNPPPGVAFVSQLGTDGDVGQLTDLQAGDYYVVATNRTTGCVSASTRFDVSDFSVTPTLAFSQTPDIGCSSSLGLGTVTALADGFNSSSAPAGYEWQWYKGSSSAFAMVSDADGGKTSTISNQAFDTYTVVVTNTNTDCSVEQRVVLEREEKYPVVTKTTATSQTACNPNGTVAVTEVTYNGTSISVNNFTFTWTSAGGAPLGSGVGMTSPPTSGSLAAGSYFVAVTHDLTGCDAEKLTEIKVKDDIALPVITIVQDAADVNCTSASGTGQLSVTADGGNNSNPPYTFEWFNGSSAIGTAFATTATVSSLTAGTYTVRASNSVTGCTDVKSFELESDPIEPKIVSFETTGVSLCNTGNGTITITSMSPDNVNSYNYELFDIKPSTPGALAIDNNATGAFSGVDVGTFWIVAEHAVTGCKAPSIQVEVEDVSIAPAIVQEDIVLQSNCVPPGTPNGSMTVSGDGSTDPLEYSFQWYSDVTLTTPVPNANGGNTATIFEITAGNYTAVVTSLTTGCSSTQTFKMIDDILSPLTLTVTSSPNDNCVDPNGRMAVSVLNRPQGKGATDYDYYWFVGNVTNPDINNADYRGQLIEEVMNGTYTVKVIDPVGGCESDPVTIQVDDNTNTNELAFEIVQDAPLTNCDPARPNGILSVNNLTSGNLSQFKFFWYTGTTPDPATLFDTLHFQVEELTSGNYTVEMIDRYTGCKIFDVINLEDATEAVPVPTITTISHRTNCLIGNGEASVSVNGDILNYDFEWMFNGVPFGNGVSFSGLEEGTYEIVATDIVTGCVSDAGTLTIEDRTIQDPEFTVLVTELSVCDENNGEAQLEEANFEIDSIAWELLSTKEIGFSTGLISNDHKLISAPPGDYSVYVRNGLGCDNTATFSIETDVVIYNGVSANGDGMNDFFIIDCSGFFPNNKCQIFNRAGQLIFEMDGYDEEDDAKRFNGISNKGVSVGSQGLPEGTYFYIFDKGDGSEVQQGYLELVR
ncbi:gliding motility-associated C-terminal domain-containing protein [Reichenbachiella sp. MALMAid0571]|uniref:gliding motility-associated C-terminal domain-containing protein n=1 Tax=Reichenbachiella sp. MALMAid0571 TaxID=3143939 RepID=UPI0032DE44CC